MKINKLNNKALELFAELMIEKIQQVSDNWERPWITRPVGIPQNAITKRSYSGFNSLALYFDAERKGYTIPAYLTFNQAKDAGAHVKKGSKGFPVVFWMRDYVSKSDYSIRIKEDEYGKLSDAEKDNYKPRLMLKDFSVFNVEQTSIPEDNPKLYEKIKGRFEAIKLNDENDMMKSPPLDDMLQRKSWLCDINVREGNRAFYRSFDDTITVPLKAQFKDGEKFYGVLLHEMAHATGAASRLNREKGIVFGDEKYAKEELVAELTSAMTASYLGISTGIKEENAMYLKNWLGALESEPDFILSLLSDVNKASNMILEVVDVREAIQKSESEDLRPVETIKPEPIVEKPDEINLFGLQKGTIYLFKGDNKPVKFTGVNAGGILNFNYVDSGKTFQLITDGKLPKAIKPFTAENANMDLNPEETKRKNEHFTLAEIPKGELKKIGVKMSELSEVDKQKLLKGKETKAINIVTDQNTFTDATLALKRNDDNSVSLVVKPVQATKEAKKKIKM
jgi:antirestriction protein ArdC